MFEIILVNIVQAAVGVMNQDHFLSSETTLGKNQRADDVVGDHAAGISNDVGVTVGESEHLEYVHSAVHARHDGQMALWGEGESTIGKIRRKLLVIEEQVVRIWCEFFRCCHSDIVSYREVVSSYDF